MKKLFITLAIILMAATAWAETPFYNANQLTLSWDAVTTDTDGDTIAGVTYRVYLANADTDALKANPVVVLETPETTATITLGTKGRYFVGLQALLGDLPSAINWVDEPTYQEASPLFGVRFAVPPNTPKNVVR